MALSVLHGEVSFSVGDTVKVHQSIQEGNKRRLQVFEGMVIAIRGDQNNKNFVVRRIGSGQIGIEKIFPLNAPVVSRVEVVRKGGEGVRRAKLYYTRNMSKKEVEKIYQRKTKRERAGEVKNKTRKSAKPKVKAKKGKK